MKQLLFTSLLLGSGLAAAAVVVPTNQAEPSNIVYLEEASKVLPGMKAPNQFTKSEFKIHSDNTPVRLNVPMREDIEQITVRVKVNDYNVAEYGNFSLVYAYPDLKVKEWGAYRAWGDAISDNEVEIYNVIPGEKYDVFLAAASTNTAFILVREGVVFTEDGEVLEMSAAEATETIEMHAVDPEGNDMKKQRVNANGEVIEDGYLVYDYFKTFLNKDWGLAGAFIGHVFAYRDSAGEIQPGNVAVIKCSPTTKFSLSQLNVLYDAETGWTTTFTAVDEFKNGVISNDVNDYRTLRDKFSRSQYEYVNPFAGTTQESQYKDPLATGATFLYMEDYMTRVSYGTFVGYEEGEVCSKDYRVCYPKIPIAGHHSAAVAPSGIEDYHSIAGEHMGIASPMAVNTPDGIMRYPLPAEISWFSIKDEKDRSVLPIVEHLAYADDESILYGSHAAPIFDFRMYDYGFSNPMFRQSFKGIFGEDRTIDNMASEIHFLRDDEELWTSFIDRQDFFYSDLAYENERAKVDFTIINRNVKIGDIQAVSTARMTYDETLEDFAPPTLTHLGYATPDGKVRDNMLSTPSSAKLVLYTADFDCCENEDGMTYYEMRKPETLKVEYAPNGSDTWKELSMIVDENKTINPGFGFHYSSPLDDVTEVSANGWYDLRVEVADAAGNKQLQTLSPAFYIGAGAGVDRVTDDMTVLVNGRDIIVAGGAAIYSLDGVRVDGRNLMPGVYVVRNGKKATKVLVK